MDGDAASDAAARAALSDALAGSDDERAAALGSLAATDAARRGRLIDPDLARALVAALDHPHRTRQRSVADALLSLLADAPALGEALRAALAAPSSRLRWGAAYVLGRAGPPPPEVWPAVAETLAREDGDQRWAAAELACRVVRASPELRSALVAGLGAASAIERKMTLYCLRDLDDPELGALARERLADPDAGVRLAALAALAKATPSEESAHAVAHLLDGDRDAGVRRAAAATLGRMGGAQRSARAALERAACPGDRSLVRAATQAIAALDRVC
jgi:HEAT repeat protein